MRLRSLRATGSKYAGLGLVAAGLVSCQLVIGIDDTTQRPDADTGAIDAPADAAADARPDARDASPDASPDAPPDADPRFTISLSAAGIIAPTELRVVAAGVDTTLTVSSDGDLTLVPAAPAGTTYAISIEGGAACALGPNAVGVVTGDDQVVLMCRGVTRLSGLALRSIAATPIAFAPATLAYTAAVSELQGTSNLTATTAHPQATLTIQGNPAASGVASAPIALDAGANALTVVVEHPLSPILATTYTVNAVRQTPAAQVFEHAPFPASFDAIGWQVATDGTSLVVGAPNEDSAADPTTANADANGSGVAYVYRRAGAVWEYQDFLKAPNADAADGFGVDVDISGSWAIVGAPFEDSGSNLAQTDNSVSRAGAAYLYERVGGDWVFRQYLKGPTGSHVVDGFYGNAVSIDGDTAVVSAYGNTAFVGSAHLVQGGQVYVYRLAAGLWSLEATLEPDVVTGANDNLGFDVAVKGNRVIAGAQAAGLVGGSGAVRIYSRSGTTWSLDAGGTLYSPDARASDFFATAVDIDGDTAVVGASEVLSVTGAGVSDTPGHAYVYSRGPTGWSPTPFTLAASNGDPDDEFGRGVAISGDLVVVSSYREDGDANGVLAAPTAGDNAADLSGAVYLYRRAGSAWIQTRYIKGEDSAAGDQFGAAVALFDEVLVVGTPGEDQPSANAGAFSVLH